MSNLKYQQSLKLPLAGLRFLVTRQDSYDSSLSEMLRTKGASVLSAPMTCIMPPKSWDSFDKTVLKASRIDWAIFTSSNGVSNGLSRMNDLDYSPSKIFSNIKVACVGRATASKLDEHGIKPDVVPEFFQTEGLLSALSQHDLQNKIFWLIQAEYPRKLLIKELKKKRSRIIFTPVYRNVPVVRDYSFLLEEIKKNKFDWILFVSPSAVETFYKILPSGFWFNLSAEPKIGCLGEITAKAVKSFGWKVEAKPKIQDFEHLVEILCEINLKKSYL